jgi:23S rRNA (cytidine1920-2'-O)/16S rRNA (cytidine1409-2'-O)-methyltransferase
MTKRQNFQSKGARLGVVSRSAHGDESSAFRQPGKRSKQTMRPKRSAPSHLPFSRGYTKLSDAAKAFNFVFRDKIVLDIGSSTGGFTKYALDHGAKKVIAVEKGTNQMVESLRHDKHIDLHEKTDIFKVRTIDFSSTTQSLRELKEAPSEDKYERCSKEGNSIVRIEVPDIIVADVSFISLKKVLSYAKDNLANEKTNFLVMLKPQFEATPDQLLNCITKNHKIRHTIIAKFEQWLKENGFLVVNKRDNQLRGKNGHIERFYWLKRTATRG